MYKLRFNATLTLAKTCFYLNYERLNETKIGISTCTESIDFLRMIEVNFNLCFHLFQICSRQNDLAPFWKKTVVCNLNSF